MNESAVTGPLKGSYTVLIRHKRARPLNAAQDQASVALSGKVRTNDVVH